MNGKIKKIVIARRRFSAEAIFRDRGDCFATERLAVTDRPDEM